MRLNLVVVKKMKTGRMPAAHQNRALLFFVLFVVAVCMAFKMDAPARKIMPLGDSITMGISQYQCYRYYLDSLLNRVGYAHDFVGSLHITFDGSTGSGYDPDHEGHWGWAADQILPQIGTWARAASPDIVLMHLGDNDILHENPNGVIPRTINELGAIIDTLRGVNPLVTIFIAQLIPAIGSRDRMYIDSLNQQIPALAASRSTGQSRIIVVDQNTGFNYATDIADDYHPNSSGARKMAAKWFAALQSSSSPPTGVTSPSFNKTTAIAHIVKTEYYNVNGQRLSLCNGKISAPAHTLAIKRITDAAGIVHTEKKIKENF
jgi:acyl-CoA thioesterase-1